jgi:hypothetical protein
MKMSEEHCADEGEWYARSEKARHHGTTCINQNELVVRLNKSGWSSASNAREWTAGTEQSDLHTCNLTGAMRSGNEHGPFGPIV